MKEYIAEYIVPVEKKGNDNMFDFMNATPLIRCKDCKYWDVSKSNIMNHTCYWGYFLKKEDDYCSWAKRRGEEDV